MSHDMIPFSLFPKQIGGLPQRTSTTPEWKRHFLSRLAGTNHEDAIAHAESHDEITFLMNHANEIRPMFSGLLRRRLLRAAAIRRVEIQNAKQNPAVLSKNEDSTRGKIYE